MRSNKNALVFLGAAFAIAAIPATAMGAGSGGFARSLGSSIQRLVDGRLTPAPFASVVFCKNNADQCTPTGSSELVALTEDRRAELASVNSGINRSISPRYDTPSRDVWSVNVTEGDCEDYALTKRYHLIKMGWPSSALRIAVATTKSGEGHAVLVVTTSGGDLVLDNRTATIKQWNQTDLSWIKIQSRENPKKWVSIGDQPPTPLLVNY